ncbi:SIR2 family protein [Sulfurimonas autotrophica]|uniref:Uncharacterized protein n=1 Tax=Sulfurimonas autotrophica (strain ATCC BAA-671 / DSM 16294 / JCM 11897 / OK10) TaxID=563040 RepID=E0UST1_SULAO|nr:SIR2 family protein [Sulfurimonas autotrophica]ADN08108.1 conserved hypothetical protein [Sulfurimonas autotrophica DSM 16294]
MNKDIQHIIEANNDNRLAFFIGSGISKSSETENHKMPLWKDLISELEKDLEGVEETNYLKLAQLYYLEYGEYLYYAKLKKIFDINLEPSNIHKLIFEIKPDYVITTNWDKLLDNTVIDNAFIYDIVVSDTDLVKSTIQKKLIKIHGDFKHHNIVFKEDDYLNYQTNFPLIENYIKSILSTHTIVFLGYSYSDYNLKQIMKWIQSFSNVKPPAYLVGFSNQSSEIKYLENHGIKSLILETDSSLGNNKYNQAVEDFLLRIKNKNVLVSENLTYESVVDYFYKKLVAFDPMNVLMPEQIKKIFKKVFYRYDSEFIILDLLQLDKSNSYYNKFVELLTKLDKNENSFKELEYRLNHIFSILSKAGIGGIMLNDKEYYKFQFPLYNALDLSNILSFKLDTNENANEAFIFYLLENNEKAYKLYENNIKSSLKSKNYIDLFLSMFNRNQLLSFLKYDFSIDYSKYETVEEYDIEEKYQDVPNNIKQTISPIISTFKDFNFIYSFAFTISSLLKEKEEQKKSIESGSIIFSNNSFEAELRHKNLIYFILGNGLAIDRYREFQTIIEYFINISLVRQVQEENIVLNQLEIFSCIKFLKEKSLKRIFESYSNKESSKRLVLDTENQKYLLQVLANTVKHIRNNDTNNFSIFENSWKKTMYLLSISKLEKEIMENILEGFTFILNTSNNSISTYQTINTFLGLQYSLYKEQFDSSKLISLIELVLNKIIYQNYNGRELYAIKSNYINNIYAYLEMDTNFNYDNLKLVQKLLFEFNSWELAQKVEISQYFLISLYHISNEKIKEEIKTFINNIEYKNIESLFEQIDFQLFLLITEFQSVDIEDLSEKIKEEISQYEDGKSMSSGLYSLQSRLQYLVEKRQILEFESLLNELTTIIENFEQKRGKMLF